MAESDNNNRASDGERNGSHSSGFGIRGVVAVMLLAVVGYYLWSKPAPLPPLAAKKTVTGREIAQGAMSFLDSLWDGGKFYEGKKCDDGNNGCQFFGGSENPQGREAAVGTAAWQLMAPVGLLALGQQERANAHAKRYFEQWLYNADGYSERFGTHQLYELFKATGDHQYMEIVWDRYELILKYSRDRYLNPKNRAAAEAAAEFSVSSDGIEMPRAGMARAGRGRIVDIPMLIATEARELAQSASILNQADLVQSLKAQDQFPGGDAQVIEIKEDLIRTSLELIRFAEKKTLEEAPDSPLVSSEPKVPRWGCWAPWAKLALYEATSDRSLLEEVLRFLQEANFSSRNPGDLAPVTLQYYLPCLHILASLNDKSVTFGKDFKFLVEHTVIPRWDSNERFLCEGKGAIFASAPMTGSFCEGNIAAVGDNSWLVMLMSKFPEQKFNIL